MNYLTIPNLPTKKVTHVIIDYRTPLKIIQELQNRGVTPILTCKVQSLYSEIQGHTDIQIHHLGGKVFTCTPDVYHHYTKLLPNCEIIQGTTTLKSNYPNNIAYNVARINNFAFHYLKFTDTNIREYYESIGVKLINVKQGYTKCNVCIIAKKAIITSDQSIVKRANNYNIDVLLIRQGHIKLGDLSYGFIGGASGLLAPDLLAFTGNIEKHPDYKKIADFCAKYNVKIISLCNDELIDIGTIMPICE